VKILIVGSGGREHALAWKILQSPRLTQLYSTSTNASTLLLQQQYGAKVAAPVKIAEHNIIELTQFTLQEQIDIVVIGSEAPLAAGLSDTLIKAGIKVFGPTQAAAQIESSKAFSKDFMARNNIATARYQTFTDFVAALNYVKNINYSIVIKASGLAAGKGVYLPESLTETETTLKELLEQHSLGAAGNEVIIEERLTGEEVSLLAFSDGYTVKLMPPARDHKRLLDHNQGPNTGGMGAYAPAINICPPALQNELAQTILQKTIDGLRAENKLFVGVLYAGLMLTPAGPRVLEFNCRFGDPETQVLMTLLDSDLLDVIEACVNGQLADCTVNWKNASAVCVILASKGYPQKNETGFVINGLNNITAQNVLAFHAGTAWQTQDIVNAGGRVLGVTAWDHNLKDAIKTAYTAIANIQFTGMQYRHDIGKLT
jgi:phosphoribosylamine--glycine ligase